MRVGSLDVGARNLHIAGNLLVAGSGNHMTMVDIQDPENPLVLSALEMPATDVVLHSGKAYAVGGDQLTVVDVRDSRAPRILGVALTGAEAELTWAMDNVAVVGRLAYATCRGTGGTYLYVFDASDPTRPAYLSEVDVGWPAIANELVVANGWLMLAAHGAGLRAFDLSASTSGGPTHPREVDVYPFGFTTSVEAIGTYAYLGRAYNGVAAVQMDEPRPMALTGWWKSQSEITSYGGWALDMALVGDRLLVADTDDGLQFLDVNDRSLPRQIAISDRQRPDEFYPHGRYVYFTETCDKSLSRLAGVSGPYPEDITASWIDIPYGACALAVDDGLAYVGTAADGLRIMETDAGPGGQLEEIGFVPGINEIGDLVVLDGYAYVLGIGTVESDHGSGVVDGLWVVDATEPATPEVVGYIALDGGGAAWGWPETPEIQLSDTRVYIAAGEGLHVVDVSAPEQPTLEAFFDTPGHPRDLILEGDRVYVADHEGGMLVFRVVPAREPIPAATRDLLNETAYLPYAFRAPYCPY
jgi:hypothetical protein